MALDPIKNVSLLIRPIKIGRWRYNSNGSKLRRLSTAQRAAGLETPNREVFAIPPPRGYTTVGRRMTYRPCTDDLTFGVGFERPKDCGEGGSVPELRLTMVRLRSEDDMKRTRSLRKAACLAARSPTIDPVVLVLGDTRSRMRDAARDNLRCPRAPAQLISAGKSQPPFSCGISLRRQIVDDPQRGGGCPRRRVPH